MNREKIWSYYGEVAKEFGEKPVKPVTDEAEKPRQNKEKEGNVVSRREGFSLQFFYENALENLTLQAPLLRVFLGDENAIDEGQWNRGLCSEDEISKWLSAGKKPYKNQIEAIRYAVSRPITLIQGPPGTGKTEMILNLLSVIHGKYPGKTVAVVSANNEAIRNITSKIEEDKAFSNLSKVYAQWGNNKRLKQWQADHSEYKRYFLEKKRDNGGPVYRFKPQLLKKIPLFSCTIHSLRKLFVREELFKQDKYEGDELFDYVIVDECSQVSTLLGLVAMASAKEHLILIGDNEQLTPVIKEDGLKAIEKEYSDEDVPARYRVNEENTFLSVCEDIFRGKASNIILNEHYRCHPAIIGFCNQYVYDGQLVVKTVNDGRFPIRVLWYEGEYSEYIYNEKEDKEDKVKKTLQNMRQIEIFLREEWMLLRNRIAKDMDTSICVISPYRGQLEKLEELLKIEIEREKNEEIKNLISSDLRMEDEKEGVEDKISCLTIHKSQGKGFDIVCFLSVCDYDSRSGGSWPQQRRMINVAVSRPKKEFHLITCNRWLPEEMQKNEVGYVISHARKTEDYYLIKLLDYTRQNFQDRNLQDGDFGFHRSTITSLFDQVPFYRKNEGEKLPAEKKDVRAASAPEKCMRDFLVKNFSEEYAIYREVPLGELYPPDECRDSELREYIKNDSKIDFLICKDKKALLAIEVDGGQHRSGEEERERHDNLKNRCFELMEKELVFQRISTDGSGCWKGTYDKDGINILSKEGEVQKMKENINKAEELSEHREYKNENGNASDCKEADAEDLLKYYKEFLVKKCMPGLQECLKNNTFPEKKDFSSEKKREYSMNEADDNLYFCQYGIAYAFEYAMLCEIMLEIHRRMNKKNIFGVYSFGCGGYIDAWALAYARAKLKRQKELLILYQGIDLKRWGKAVFGDIIDETWPTIDSNNVKCLDKLHIVYENTERNISKFIFSKPLWDEKNGIQAFVPVDQEGNEVDKMRYNVLMFPKILNDLDEKEINDFVDRLRSFKYSLDDYYLCVSHSPFDLEHGGKGAKAVRKIVEMFQEKGFEHQDNLQEMLGDENLLGKYKILDDNNEDISAYLYYVVGREKTCSVDGKTHALFKKDKNNNNDNEGKGKKQTYIVDPGYICAGEPWYDIIDEGAGFRCEEVHRFLMEANNMDKNKKRKCQQMINANIVFQIIKFTKKGKK